MKKILSVGLITLSALLGPSAVTLAQDATVLREALYSGSIGSRGSRRSAVFTDPILARYAAGTLAAPQEGEVSGKNSRGETVHWKRIEADESGTLSDRSLRSGTLYLTHHSDSDRVAVLRTNGNSEILVNGVPRAGDIYSKGWIMLPVQLKKGLNEFWLKSGRLLHGFGFAGALTEIGLPQSDIPLALLMFNVGVEIGQLLFISAVIIAIVIWKRFSSIRLDWLPRTTAYAIGGLSSFWVFSRVALF